MKPWPAFGIGCALMFSLLAGFTWIVVLNDRDHARTELDRINQGHAQAVAAFEASRRGFDRVLDSLTTVRAAQSVALEATTAANVALRARLAARRPTQHNSTAGDTVSFAVVVATQDSLIEGLTAENTSLRAALATEVFRGSQLTLAVQSRDSMLAAERVRAGALEAMVRARLPAPPGKLFGFLPKPSRGLMFVAGSIAGAMAVSL